MCFPEIQQRQTLSMQLVSKELVSKEHLRYCLCEHSADTTALTVDISGNHHIGHCSLQQRVIHLPYLNIASSILY